MNRLTEKETIQNKARLAEIMLDKKTPIVLGGKTYEIGALTYYAKWLISDRITQMELENSELTNLIQCMAADIPLMAECIAIGILVKRERIERELNNLKFELMDNIVDGEEWIKAITTIFAKLDCGFFFGVTEMVRAINSMNDKAGLRKEVEKNKATTSGFSPIQNTAR